MLTALLFRFPFPGPWGKELTEASRDLARDIANEHGLAWKIWLEDRETGHAGGIYLFEDAAAAERYREKHERGLSAMPFGKERTGIERRALRIGAEAFEEGEAGRARRQFVLSGVPEFAETGHSVAFGRESVAPPRVKVLQPAAHIATFGELRAAQDA